MSDSRERVYADPAADLAVLTARHGGGVEPAVEAASCRAAQDPQQVRRARLVRMIEAEIIPRLVLARRATAEIRDGGSNGARLGSEQVAEFARVVLTHDAAVALSLVDGLRARGVPVERLYLELLAPAARRLGELWAEDLCDFTEVTVGLGRLQQVMHELSPAFRNECAQRDHGRCILLAPVPGEQHTFGLWMVAEFFRRAGWHVWSLPLGTAQEMAALARREWFAVVGLSAACPSRIDALAAAIRMIRRSSRNRAVGVMVGGPLVLSQPDLVPLVGADATAVDARQAVLQAQDLLALLAERR